MPPASDQRETQSSDSWHYSFCLYSSFLLVSPWLDKGHKQLSTIISCPGRAFPAPSRCDQSCLTLSTGSASFFSSGDSRSGPEGWCWFSQGVADPPAQLITDQVGSLQDLCVSNGFHLEDSFQKVCNNLMVGFLVLHASNPYSKTDVMFELMWVCNEVRSPEVPEGDEGCLQLYNADLFVHSSKLVQHFA